MSHKVANLLLNGDASRYADSATFTKRNEEAFMLYRRILSLRAVLVSGLLTFLATASMAQPSRMPMRDGMMMGGWGMLLWTVIAVLVVVALILAILALWKYLSGK